MPDATDRRIVEVRHFEHPSGVDEVDIRSADETIHTATNLPWAEARASAEHPSLDHRDDEPGATAWSRRHRHGRRLEPGGGFGDQ